MFTDPLDIAADADGTIAEAVRLLQSRGTQVLNAIDDGVVFLDRIGRVIFVNEAGARLFGYTNREMLGRSLHSLTHHHYADGTDFPPEECPILATVHDAVQQRVGGDTFFMKGGTPLPVDYTSIPIKEGRTVLGVVVTFRDISDQQRAEEQSLRLKSERAARAEAEEAREALRASESRYRFLAEAIPVQIWTARPDGALDYVTQRVADEFGITQERILGEGWLSVLHPDDVAPAVTQWTHSLTTGTPYQMEFRLRRADGEFRWYLARALPQLDESGQIMQWCGTNTDINEQKQEQKR